MDLTSVGSHVLVTSVRLGSNCWLSKYWNSQLCSVVQIPPKVIRVSASTTGVWPCKSLYHVRPSVVWRPSLAAVIKNMKRLVAAWCLASQQYFCSSLFLQPQMSEKRQNISPETEQRLAWMIGVSSPLNTRPPKEFHNLNFVFSLPSAHWPPSPTALQLPVSPPITNPFFHIFHSGLYSSVYQSQQHCPCQSHECDWHSCWRKTKNTC